MRLYLISFVPRTLAAGVLLNKPVNLIIAINLINKSWKTLIIIIVNVVNGEYKILLVSNSFEIEPNDDAKIMQLFVKSHNYNNDFIMIMMHGDNNNNNSNIIIIIVIKIIIIVII